MIAMAQARRKAAELAQRFTGWTVWVTAQGSPAATRSGRLRPRNRTTASGRRRSWPMTGTSLKPNWQRRRSMTRKD